MSYVIIAYDISNDSTRDDIRNYLRKYFYHVQKSVFEGYIRDDRLREIIRNLIKRLYHGDKLVVVILDYKNFKKIQLGKKEENIF